MVTFFPWIVQSAVPGGLGRWLLSCAGGCCAKVSVDAMRQIRDAAVKLLRFIGYVLSLLKSERSEGAKIAAIAVIAVIARDREQTTKLAAFNSIGS